MRAPKHRIPYKNRIPSNNYPKSKEWVGTVAKIVQGMQYTGVNPLATRTFKEIRNDLIEFCNNDQFWESVQQLEESIRGMVK